MKGIQFMSIAVILSIGLAMPILSHHSLASYDQSTLVPIKGEVTKIDWINPHAVITLTVKNADGTSTAQRIEIAPPNALTRKFGKNLLNIGDSVTFETWLPKDPQVNPVLNGRTLILVDGRRFDVGDSLAWTSSNRIR